LIPCRYLGRPQNEFARVAEAIADGSASEADPAAIQVHWGAVVAFNSDFDGRRLGKSIEGLRELVLGELVFVEIDADMNAPIDRECEGLDDRPVGEDIGRDVDFLAGAIDKRHVDVLKVFGWRVV
jgi:hypothetical protein